MFCNTRNINVTHKNYLFPKHEKILLLFMIKILLCVSQYTKNMSFIYNKKYYVL